MRVVRWVAGLPAAVYRGGAGSAHTSEENPGRLRVDRWEIDRAFREKVSEVLTEAQRAAMPHFGGQAVFRTGGGYGVRL